MKIIVQFKLEWYRYRSTFRQKNTGKLKKKLAKICYIYQTARYDKFSSDFGPPDLNFFLFKFKFGVYIFFYLLFKFTIIDGLNKSVFRNRMDSGFFIDPVPEPVKIGPDPQHWVHQKLKITFSREVIVTF